MVRAVVVVTVVVTPVPANQHAAPKIVAAMMVAKLPAVPNLLVALKTAATTVATRVVIQPARSDVADC